MGDPILVRTTRVNVVKEFLHFGHVLLTLLHALIHLQLHTFERN
jgi:hypothetical protein